MTHTRIAPFALGVLAALVASAASAEAQPPPAPPPGSASATMSECREALDQAGRSVTFAAEMTAEPTTTHMEVHLRLLERSGAHGSLRVVRAPGLSVWRRSEPGVQVYRYLKQILNLPAPASYHADISFRWLDAREHTIRTAERRTPTCEQHDPRARLTLGPLSAQPSADGASAEYSVEVRNSGHGPSPATELLLRVDGGAQALQGVPSLAPGARTQLTVRGPLCRSGGSVHLILDPGRRVDEAPGGGRARTLPCPPGPPPAAPPGGGAASSAGV